MSGNGEQGVTPSALLSMHETVVDGGASGCRALSKSGIGDVCGCWAGKAHAGMLSS